MTWLLKEVMGTEEDEEDISNGYRQWLKMKEELNRTSEILGFYRFPNTMWCYY
jgi:hypothetical protein